MTTRELAQDVQDAVDHDFTLHYRVTDTEQFLDRLLPVQMATCDTILQYMKEKALYDSDTQRWRGYPDPHKESDQGSGPKRKKKKLKENLLYGPFCATAEAIREFVEKQRPTALQMGDTKWMDYHSKSPRSEDSQAARLRPDALFAFQVIADQTVWKECQQGEQEEADKDADDDADEDAEDDAEEEEKTAKEEENQAERGLEEGNAKGNGKARDNLLQSVWWLQIIAAVEMKPKNFKNWDDSVKQLIGYLRRILREQLDRRFVFGLTVGPDMMTVWMHDRSGVIGTKTAINFHKEPLRFIQVIAAFSLLPPDKLGFDPTIEMLVSPDRAVPSYRPDEEFLRAYQTARHNRQWVIRMNDGTMYVTVQTVSSVRAGFMRGRGSIVWVVVPFSKAEDFKILVLKQSWRPRDVDSEGKLYDDSSCDNVGKIDRCEEVSIAGWDDATDTLIRQGLEDSMPLGKRSRDQMAESKEPGIHVRCTDVGDIKEVIARQTGPPVPRVRTRVILSTYGWEIKYFSTRRELLVVLRDAIRGHQYLYKRGVLHRDVSPGNILIKWRPGSKGDQPSTSGCLIDLDHAKKGNPVLERVTAESVNDKLDDFILSWCAMKGLEKDVACQALVCARQALVFFPGDATALLKYLEAALQHTWKFRPFKAPLTPQHLGWQSVEMLHNFEFRPNERRGGSRTGTPPYTSGEILSGRRYFPGHKGTVFHDAVHDIESFFWVLVHICITRQEPGGVRRGELEQGNRENEEYDALRRVVHFFFDSSMSTMALNKAEIFTHPDEFEPYVLANFHGYFLPLRDLVREWYHLLILAHQFHAFEYQNIHDMVLEIIDRALESPLPDDISEAPLKTLHDRKANIEKLSDRNLFGKVQLPPRPHTSPKSRRQVSQPVDRSLSNSPTPAPKRGKTHDARK